MANEYSKENVWKIMEDTKTVNFIRQSDCLTEKISGLILKHIRRLTEKRARSSLMNCIS